MKHSSAFKPAWWLNNPHLQTIFPALFRRVPALKLRRQRLFTPDEDFLDLDFCGESDGPLVILLHGLTGSSASGYIRGLQFALLQQGFCSVALNFRGCSGTPNHTARCYHSGETADLDFVYRYLRDSYPHTDIAAVGFSLGGNVLLKWLGEHGKQIDLFAAAAVSVPLLLDKCATRLDLGLSILYRNRLLAELKAYLQNKRRHLLRIQRYQEAEKLAALGDISAISSFWEYDEQVVAKLYGFNSAADYYQRSSARQFLKAIQIPTLLVQAADDPFMTPAVLPAAAELSDFIQMEITHGGGHVGFISGHYPFRPRYWLDSRITAFLSTHYRPNDDLIPKV